MSTPDYRAQVERDYATARDLIRRAEASNVFDGDDDPHALRDAVKRLHGSTRGAVDALARASVRNDYHGNPTTTHGWVQVSFRPEDWATLDRLRGQ